MASWRIYQNYHTLKHLYRQVEEQSDVCDVTIQVGNWERRYHWCILIVSPFFEAVHRNNLKERQTGHISFGIGTPLAVDTVIKHLYGQELEVGEETVKDVLEVADFLLMENIKSECISFYQNEVEITDDNFLQLMEVSTAFSFEINSLEDFLLDNILELLSNPDMLEINVVAITSILKNETYTCISKELFEFIIKWVSKSPSTRASAFRELFSYLSLDAIGEEFVEETVTRETLVKSDPQCMERISTWRLQRERNKRPFVFLNGDAYQALSSEDGRVSYLGSVPRPRLWAVNDMKCISISSSDQTKVHILDLASRKYVTKNIKQTDIRLDHLVAGGGVVYGIAKTDIVNNHRPFSYGRRYCSTVYAVEISDSDNIDLRPWLSFPNHTVAACATNDGVLCLMFASAWIALYNPKSSSVKLIEFPSLSEPRSSSINFLSSTDYRISEHISSFGQNACMFEIYPTLTCYVYEYGSEHNESPTKTIKLIEILIDQEGSALKTTVKLRSILSPPYSRYTCIRKVENRLLAFRYGRVDIYDPNAEPSWSTMVLKDKVSSEKLRGAALITLPVKNLQCALNCPHARTPVASEKVTQSNLDRISSAALSYFLSTSWQPADQSSDESYGGYSYYDGYVDSDDYYFESD